MNNMQQKLMQLRQNPQQFIQQAGLKIPQEMMSDPQQMVIHLINTNQVGGPIAQMIKPMIKNMPK